MKAKIEIDVDSEQQADAIKAALTDPEMRAFAVVVGLLLPHTPRARRRILMFVEDQLDELREAEP
jgi:hypothetical protein